LGAVGRRFTVIVLFAGFGLLAAATAIVEEVGGVVRTAELDDGTLIYISRHIVAIPFVAIAGTIHLGASHAATFHAAAGIATIVCREGFTIGMKGSIIHTATELLGTCHQTII